MTLLIRSVPKVDGVEYKFSIGSGVLPSIICVSMLQLSSSSVSHPGITDVEDMRHLERG